MGSKGSRVYRKSRKYRGSRGCRGRESMGCRSRVYRGGGVGV